MSPYLAHLLLDTLGRRFRIRLAAVKRRIRLRYVAGTGSGTPCFIGVQLLLPFFRRIAPRYVYSVPRR